MITDLPAGTLFVTRYNGGRRLWVLHALDKTTMDERRLKYLKHDTHAMSGLPRPVQVGETIHNCVSKTVAIEGIRVERLESRGTYVVRAGDVEWVDTGFLGLADKHGNRYPVFANRFTAQAPKWLQDVS